MARLNVAFHRALDTNADPVNGGKLYVFTAGTTTPVTTYSDSDMTLAQAHPIVADAAGLFPTIYVQPGSYKVRITDAVGVVLYETDAAPDKAFPVIYNDIASLKASLETGRGIGALWQAGSYNFEEASTTATDHHILTTGGVKLYEAGIEFSTEARLVQAINRMSLTPSVGEVLSAGDIEYVYKAFSTGNAWEKQTPLSAVNDLASAAIPDTPGAVDVSRLAQVAASTIMGNPSTAEGDIVPMLANVAAHTMGLKLTRSGDKWSLEIPTKDETIIIKGGRATVASATTSVNVLFPEPFPNTRMNSPMLTTQSGGAEINVEVPDPYTVGGATEADGFTITAKEWDAATSLWVTLTADAIISWVAWGY